MNRHLVIRVTTDARASRQAAELVERLTETIAEFERLEEGAVDDEFPTVIDWSWTYEDD